MFEVKFNWQGEVHVFRSLKPTQIQAYRACVTALAKKLGRTRLSVQMHLAEGNRFEIKEVN